MLLADMFSTQMLSAQSAGTMLAEIDIGGVSRFTYRLLPPFTTGQALVIAAAVIGGALVLRLLLVPANPVSRHGVLWALRLVVLFLIGVILFANPVRQESKDGPIQRPEVFYLLDT